MHDNDKFETVTLCQLCHAKKHPGRVVAQVAKNNVRTEIWTTIPRNLNIPFTHSTLIRPKKALGLIGFQTLLGLNWYILNGYSDSRIVEFNRRQFAKLIGKKPSTSFNRSLDEALKCLRHTGVLAGHNRSGNTIEAIFEPDYLKILGANPWFISLDDIPTNSMCVLTLRWFLSMQSNRKMYQIGLDKLKGYIGMTVSNQGMAIKALRKACEAIEWANVDMKKGICTFALQRRGATPVYSLRDRLTACLEM